MPDIKCPICNSNLIEALKFSKIKVCHKNHYDTLFSLFGKKIDERFFFGNFSISVFFEKDCVKLYSAYYGSEYIAIGKVKDWPTSRILNLNDDKIKKLIMLL